MFFLFFEKSFSTSTKNNKKIKKKTNKKQTKKHIFLKYFYAFLYFFLNFFLYFFSKNRSRLKKNVAHIFWDMDFKFVLPIIYINIKGKTRLEVNWTQIDHFGLQKNIKMAISQNAILANGQFWSNWLSNWVSLLILMTMVSKTNLKSISQKIWPK